MVFRQNNRETRPALGWYENPKSCLAHSRCSVSAQHTEVLISACQCMCAETVILVPVCSQGSRCVRMRVTAGTESVCCRAVTVLPPGCIWRELPVQGCCFFITKRRVSFCGISLDSPSISDKWTFWNICSAAPGFHQARGYGPEGDPRPL